MQFTAEAMRRKTDTCAALGADEVRKQIETRAGMGKGECSFYKHELSEGMRAGLIAAGFVVDGSGSFWVVQW